MKKFSVLIAGRGKLARELLQDLHGSAILNVSTWKSNSSDNSNPYVVVHAGSGRELGEIIEFCTSTHSLLLDLSTGDSPLPESPSFPIVLCPNVNLQMLYFMAMVKQASGFFCGMDIQITESHQSGKTTKPGTAIYLARSLGLPESSIHSVRNPEEQSEILGIPPAYLDRHAYHKIKIQSPEVEINLETKVLGKSAYARGLSKILELSALENLAPGYHDIVDLITPPLQKLR